MTTKYLSSWLYLISIIINTISQILNNFSWWLNTITIKISFISPIFIPSDPMRPRATTFIKINNSAFFLLSFFGNVSNKKTPLKHLIFHFFDASSSSKLFNGLLGNITFLIEIMFLIRKYLLYRYYQPKN